MKRLTYSMLTSSEQSEYRRLAQIASETANKQGQAQDNANAAGVFSKPKAIKFFFYLTKQKVDERVVKNYLRWLRDKYGCGDIDRDSFPNYPYGLYGT
jgi:hypothetical protein